MGKQFRKLAYADRQKIERMIEQGIKPKEIAVEIGVTFQTIYKELKRGKDEAGKYSAEKAQKTLFC